MTAAGRRGADRAVTLTVRQWQYIDAVLDNQLRLAAETGDPRRVLDTGRSIREAGWDQVAHRTPEVSGPGNWPPGHQMVAVVLGSSQWELVLTCLGHSAEVDEGIGDVETAAELREIGRAHV